VRPLATFLVSALLFAQQSPPQSPQNPAAAAEDDVEFVCPMDKDVRSKTPGKCPRCGMTLVAGIPDPHEYPVRITTRPVVLKAGEDVELKFRVEDPIANQPVRDFEIMHERLYHLFVVSQDTKFFLHTHPQVQADGSLELSLKFPHPGLYRVLSDFYPKGGTPQLIASSLFVQGSVQGERFKLEPAKLQADLSPQRSENLEVELSTDPPEPIAGFKTLLFFKLKPNEGIEPYIGAWGHMLAASSDLIDLIHTHPFLVTDPDAGGYKQIQFNLIFPRSGIYRVWIQFQRKGVVNTVAFNIPVKTLD
jgi:hypothetical protein